MTLGPSDVYIGRPGKWGNPFVMKSEEDRQFVIDQFIAWLATGGAPYNLEDIKRELKGKKATVLVSSQSLSWGCPSKTRRFGISSMGYYIEATGAKGKAAWLVQNAKGTIVSKATPSPDSIPVVVMDNGPFEAAGIAYSQRELDEFTYHGDTRPKTIVMVPRAEVIKHCPRVESRLSW